MRAAETRATLLAEDAEERVLHRAEAHARHAEAEAARAQREAAEARAVLKYEEDHLT